MLLFTIYEYSNSIYHHLYIYFKNQYLCEAYIPTSLHPDLLLQKFMQMLILELLSQQKIGKSNPPPPTKKEYGLLQCT
jgi:hypothetical protein